MKHLINILLLSLILHNLCLAQYGSVEISGYIKDKETGTPLNKVNIKIKGTLLGATSNKDGFYNIPIINVPITLIFSHIGYKEKHVEIKYRKNQKIDVTLEKDIYLLGEVTISPSPVIDIIKDKPLYVTDYSFYDNNLLLLAYEHNNSSDSKLFLMDNNGNVICSKPVEKARNLYKDCLDNNHVISKDITYQIYIDSTDILLLYPTPNDTFNKYFNPIVEYFDSKYYLRQYYYNNQLLLYYYYNKTDSSFKEFRVITDELRLRMLKDLPRLMQSDKFTEEDLRFENMCMYPSVFAPLVKIKDTIYIFNYKNSNIELYSKSDELIKEVPVSFHNDKSWKEEIYIDEVLGKAYALFNKNGISRLSEINLTTGSLNKTVVIPDFIFVEKINIRNGVLYFLYKEKSDAEYKKLYKMTI